MLHVTNAITTLRGIADRIFDIVLASAGSALVILFSVHYKRWLAHHDAAAQARAEIVQQHAADIQDIQRSIRSLRRQVRELQASSGSESGKSGESQPSTEPLVPVSPATPVPTVRAHPRHPANGHDTPRDSDPADSDD